MKKTKVLCALSAFVLLMACNTYQKQLNKATTFFMANKAQLASLCEMVYPVKDSIGETVIDSTHKANNINYQGLIDSVQRAEDSLQMLVYTDTAKSNPCAEQSKTFANKLKSITDRYNKLVNSYRPCKPDTVYKKQTIYVKDMAEITVLTNQLNVKVDSLKITKHDLQLKITQSSARLKWIFILAGILLGLCAITVLKFMGKFGL